MEERLAPVALFVYNRPQHTFATLSALALNRYADQTDLIIFSDGAKSTLDKPSVELTRKIISDVKGFKSVTVHLTESNMGLATSIINGVSEVLIDHECIIVLEDDLITSVGFLEYMNSALEFYNESAIFSISGYSPNIKIGLDYPFSTFYNGRICSWGWATWRNKWEHIDWEVKDFDSFFRSNRLTRGFNSCGNDLSIMLYKYKIGEIKSWAIRFAYHTFKNGGGAIYPTQSLIKNMGADGSGTNMKESHKYWVDGVDEVDTHSFCSPYFEDENIRVRFKKFYNTSNIRRAINIFKRSKYLLLASFGFNEK